ncbi:MAG TPA: WD40 repeat domain-containing protein [Chloroflexota bacterium]
MSSLPKTAPILATALARAAVRPLRWLAASDLRAWCCTFVVFEAVLYVGGIAGDGRLAALVGVAAVLVGLVLLLARRRIAGPPPRAAQAGCHGCARRDLAASGVVAAAGIAATAGMFLTSPPIAELADSQVYVSISDGLLGRGPLNLFHLTYPYPLVIALTRLVWDSPLSIVLLQHAVRVGVAVAAYWTLRGAGRGFALVAGVLLALDPFTTYYAHSLLTESLYASAVLGLLLLTYRLGERQTRAAALGVGLGALAAWTSLFRPAGMLLVVPLLAYVLVRSRAWRRALYVGVGFVGVGLCLALGQWRLTDRFGFGTGSDVYYAFPYFHHELYDPNNGPLADEAFTYLPSPSCQFSLPEGESAQLQLNDVAFPQRFPACLDDAAARTGSRLLAMRALYGEGIRANPVRFLTSSLTEMGYFVTHLDWARTGAVVYRSGLQIASELRIPAPDRCAQGEQAAPTAYTCRQHYSPDPRFPAARFHAWAQVFANVVQPYRLQGTTFGARGAAALLLTALLLVAGDARMRRLTVLCWLVIGYHAAVTALGQWNLLRYVAVVTPEFLLLTSMAATLLGRQVMAAVGPTAAAIVARRATAPPLGRGVALLALLVGCGLLLGAASHHRDDERTAARLATVYAESVLGSDPAPLPGEPAGAAPPVLGQGLVARALVTRDDLAVLEQRPDGIWYRSPAPLPAPAVRRLDGLEAPVETFAVSPAGGRLAASGADGQVRVWEPGEPGPGRPLAGQADRARALAFGAEQALLVGEDGGRVQVWRGPDDGQPLLLQQGTRPLRYVAGNEAGTLVAAADDQDVTCLWELPAGGKRGCVDEYRGAIASVAFSPDGALWATGSRNGALRVFDTATMAQHSFRYVPDPYVYDLAFSADSTQLGAAAPDGKVAVWAVGPPGGLLAHLGWVPGVPGWPVDVRTQAAGTPHVPLWSLAWSASGTLAVGADDGAIWLWTPGEAAPPRALAGHQGPVLSVAWSPSGATLASGAADRTVRTWDAASATPSATLTGPERGVYRVAFRDELHVRARSWDGTAREWTLPDGEPSAMPDGAPLLRAAAESADGRRAVGTPGGRIRLERAAGGEERVLAGHAGRVTALAFSADGRWLASGGADARVRVWDTASGEQVAQFAGHRGDVTAVAFRPDGGLLASAGWDGRVNVWQLPDGGDVR